MVGEVEDFGKNVKKFKKGDKVMLGPFRNCCEKCEFCLKGKSNACIGMMPNERFLYNKYFGGYSTHC